MLVGTIPLGLNALTGNELPSRAVIGLIIFSKYSCSPVIVFLSSIVVFAQEVGYSTLTILFAPAETVLKTRLFRGL